MLGQNQADLVAQEIDAAFQDTLLKQARFTSDTELWNSVYGFKQALKSRIDALVTKDKKDST